MWARCSLLAIVLVAGACDGGFDSSSPSPQPSPTSPQVVTTTWPDPPRRDEGVSQEWLDAVAARLVEGRGLWEAAGLDAYDLTYRGLAIFDCPDQITVAVRPDTDPVRTRPGDCSRAEDAALPIWTVESLFDLVERGVEQRAHRVSLDIDPALGFPTRAYVDPEYGVPDEEQGAEVLAVVPAAGADSP